MSAIDFLEDEMSEVTLRYIREIDYLEDWIVSAMKAYAKAKLEEAAERARMKFHDGHDKTDSYIKYFQSGGNNLTIDKQSITNTPLD